VRLADGHGSGGGGGSGCLFGSGFSALLLPQPYSGIAFQAFYAFSMPLSYDPR
jgi:hypothetical protein